MMATCPTCDHEVQTPFFFNLTGWSQLTCTQCKARLEIKPRTVGVWFLPILLSLFWLSRLGHIYAVVAELLLAFATVTLVLLLIVRPQVRLRKRSLPKPTIQLKIDSASN